MGQLSNCFLNAATARRRKVVKTTSERRLSNHVEILSWALTASRSTSSRPGLPAGHVAKLRSAALARSRQWLRLRNR